MGTFYATIEIGDPQGQHYRQLEALVDTGSTYTWIPRDILAGLGVEPAFQRDFVLADGHLVRRDMAVTLSRRDGQTIPTLVVFSETGSTPLLGAYTMEGFGVAPDLVNRRLVPTPGLAMATIPTNH